MLFRLLPNLPGAFQLYRRNPAARTGQRSLVALFKCGAPAHKAAAWVRARGNF